MRGAGFVFLVSGAGRKRYGMAAQWRAEDAMAQGKRREAVALRVKGEAKSSRGFLGSALAVVAFWAFL
jgi:hypothetical protein